MDKKNLNTNCTGKKNKKKSEIIFCCYYSNDDYAVDLSGVYSRISEAYSNELREIPIGRGEDISKKGQ